MSNIHDLGLDLIYAAAHGDLVKTSDCIKKGAIIDCEDRFGQTPLMAAISNTYTSGFNIDNFGASKKEAKRKVLLFLLEKGANVNKQNKFGETPLHMAVKQYNIDIVQLLLTPNGAFPDSKDKEGYTPLMSAIISSHPDDAALLIMAGADLNLQNKYGESALMLCAKNNSNLIARFLIENKKTNIHLEDLDGKTARDHAEENDNEKFISILNQFD